MLICSITLLHLFPLDIFLSTLGDVRNQNNTVSIFVGKILIPVLITRLRRNIYERKLEFYESKLVLKLALNRQEVNSFWLSSILWAHFHLDVYPSVSFNVNIDLCIRRRVFLFGVVCSLFSPPWFNCSTIFLGVCC